MPLGLAGAVRSVYARLLGGFMDALRRQLARTTTLTFDCYGTLIDWSAGLGQVFQEVFGDRAAADRDRLFEAYVKIEAELESGAYRSYVEIVTLTLERLAQRMGLPLSNHRRDAIAERLPAWKPFSDTNEALKRLKEKYRVGVLSNIDRDLFTGTARQFSVPFGFLIAAEDVRSYKPGLGHFARLREQEGSLDHVVHVAQSLYHDGAPAGELGLAFVWINRYKERSVAAVQPFGEFPDLRSFADIACG